MTNDPISTLTNMARQLLAAQTDLRLDRTAIERAVHGVAPIVAATGRDFTAHELTSVVRILESLFVVEQGEALALTDRRLPPEWYVGERRRPGPFMTRYLQKLAEDGWPVRSVEELRDSTARVLELLDDPHREGPWDWRGLVVGDVQSGKTAHYAGVINRAADAGYRVIVILAGMHNVLRLQTNRRHYVAAAVAGAGSMNLERRWFDESRTAGRLSRPHYAGEKTGAGLSPAPELRLA